MEKGEPTILMTGATGFLGSHLLRALLEQKFQVVVLGRQVSRRERIAPLLSRVVFYERERCDLNEVFEQHSFSMVVHCATHYGRRADLPTDIIEVNLALPLHLLQLCRSWGVRAFLNTDTVLDKRVSHYTLSKKQFVEWLRVFSDEMVGVNVALEHFYGPGDDESKFAMFIVRQLLAGVENLSLTPGEQKRDFVYVEDVVRALQLIIELCLRRDCGFHEFEVGSGHSASVREFVCLARRIAQGSVPTTRLDFGALPYRAGEVMETHINTSQLEALGWHAQVSLEDGLTRTILAERKRSEEEGATGA